MVLWLLALVLFLLTPAQAANRHTGAGTDTLRELQAQLGDGFHGYVVTGCLHPVSASTSATMPACRAYARDGTTSSLLYFEDLSTRTVTYTSGDGFYYLIGHSTLTDVPATWVRQAGTHYLWHKATTVEGSIPGVQVPVRPTLPAKGVWLAQVILTAGAITTVLDMRDGRPYGFEVDVTAPLYGVAGDGVTDDSAALTALCNSVRQRYFAYSETPQKVVFPPGKTYSIESGVVCELNKFRTDVGNTDKGDTVDVVFEAYGAKFLVPPNILMWNWSPNTLCVGATIPRWGEPALRRVWWLGGTFVGPETYHVDSHFMKAFGIRGFHLKDTVVTGFHTVLNVCIQDNFYVTENRWGSFVYGIHQNDTLVQQETGPNGGATASHVRIFNNLLSGGESDACICNICLEGNAIQSAWITSNSISGECSRGWIHLATGDTDATVNGPIVIESNEMEQATSAATGIRLFTSLTCPAAVVPGTCTQPTIGLSLRNNDMRFSQTDGFTAISLENVNGASVLANVFTPVAATDWVALKLTNVANLRADGNHIQDPKGGTESPDPSGGTCIKFMDNLSHSIQLGNFFCKYQELEAYGGVDDTAMGTGRRWAWGVGAPIRFTQGDYRNTPEDSTGAALFGGTTALTTGTATVDMDRVANLNLGFGQGSGLGVIPWGYHMRVHLKDTASASGSSDGNQRPIPGVSVRTVVGTGLTDELLCSAAGLVDNTWTGCEGIVRADVNGDVYVSYRSTGAGTLRVVLTVTAIYQ